MKETIIYCLKNPLTRNTVFYIGKTTQSLNKRLEGHLYNKNINSKVYLLIQEILRSGVKPIINELETCKGYFLPSVRERYWIHRFNKNKTKLTNHQFANISTRTMNMYLELTLPKQKK